MPRRYPAGESFAFGAAKTLRKGKDIALLALGAVEVGEALKAAELLEVKGLSAMVVDMFTLAPLDTALVMDLARSMRGIVTCENHRVSGGLGSAVAELLSALPTHAPLARIGVGANQFGEVGTQDWLAEHFGLTASHIAKAALGLCGKGE